MLQKGSKVKHTTRGIGIVKSIDADEIIVRFESGGIEICPPSSLV